ncbi:MAG: CRISPR-associated endonuclease Cas6 [Saprospiraceae bacterium]|nr:hypothetical protein [Lewinella sp.]
MPTPLTTLTFPHIRLATRDAHKLRGYFGNLFREHSPLLHNHLEGGDLRYAYPLVQYKVLREVPTLLGIGEGAQLLIDLFLQLHQLEIDGEVYPLDHKDLQCREVDAGYSGDLHTYRFLTQWMALNQKNYVEYRDLPAREQEEKLRQLLRNHILAAFKGLGIWLEPQHRILTQTRMETRSTHFKDQRMLTFTGEFTTNAVLPRWIGLGKSVSRGFGAVELVSS